MTRIKNPLHGKFKLPSGYTDGGWLNGGAERCSHRPQLEYDNSFFQCRGTDIIYICDTCKTVWHVDMSD